MVGALVPIYHGAYASLRTPQSTRKALKKRRSSRKSEGEAAEEDEDDDESVTLPETLTSEDAYWLPVIGSVVLFSMFLVFKYLDKTWVDRVLGFYFAVVGIFAVSRVSVHCALSRCAASLILPWAQVFLLIAGGIGAFTLVDSARYTLTKTSRDSKTAAAVKESEWCA